MNAALKICISCNRAFRGRADKKFCNDYCRNSHHNRLNSDENNYVRNVNYCLRKNRRILAGLFPREQTRMATCTKQKLHNQGFSFNYFTHTKKNKKGTTIIYCYEYGCILRSDEKVMVVRKKKILSNEIS